MNKLTSLDTLRTPDPDTHGPGHEADLVLWFEKQAAHLRAKKFERLDLENLIEELEAMAGRDRRELHSRIEVLLMHLLKCAFQPESKSASWIGTIGEQRSQIEKLLEQSPSLQLHVSEYARAAYPKAVKRAADQTHLPRAIFPKANPYSDEQLLDDDFLP